MMMMMLMMPLSKKFKGMQKKCNASDCHLITYSSKEIKTDKIAQIGLTVQISTNPQTKIETLPAIPLIASSQT